MVPAAVRKVRRDILWRMACLHFSYVANIRFGGDIGVPAIFINVALEGSICQEDMCRCGAIVRKKSGTQGVSSLSVPVVDLRDEIIFLNLSSWLLLLHLTAGQVFPLRIFQSRFRCI